MDGERHPREAEAMHGTVVAGLDGSAESRAAADWAAREALRRAAPLTLLHAVAPPVGRWTDAEPAPVPGPGPTEGAADELRGAYPGLSVSADEVAGQALPVLFAAAAEADLMVLGSRGTGAVEGFLLGSVALNVAGQAPVPVVLVRSAQDGDGKEGEDEAAGVSARGEVVVGLDLAGPGDAVLAFAFGAAARGNAPLRVVHGGDPGGSAAPGGDAHGDALERALRPWRERFPDTEVIDEAVVGTADRHLLDVSSGAGLLVIGRRADRTRLAPHIGAVAHTILHHARVPVAVVPHEGP
jgi:nucleotide-binding universal stress UspA family protein